MELLTSKKVNEMFLLPLISCLKNTGSMELSFRQGKHKAGRVLCLRRQNNQRTNDAQTNRLQLF